MKKLLVLVTLLAAFASFGCGSDEPAADAPTKAPTATTKEVEKQDKNNNVTTKQEEKKVYSSDKNRPKLTETKPSDTIHHFSK